MRATILPLALLTVLTVLVPGGCNIDLQFVPGDGDTDGTSTGGVTRLRSAVGTVQADDPRAVDLPEVLVDAGDTVIINQDVNVIINIEDELVVEELPDVTVLGFDNQTGFDLYLRYLADDESQGVYVYDGETLLLEYPCLTVVELLSEDDLDPLDGLLVDSFELTDVYFNPDDFVCGDALVLVFDPLTVEITVELVELLD